MADLGSIGITTSSSKKISLPVWSSGNYLTWHQVPQSNFISGTVSSAGVGLGNIIVRLYDRINGELVRQTFTASDGTYSFDLLSSTEKFYVVAILHNRNEPGNNALIADYLTPA